MTNTQQPAADKPRKIYLSGPMTGLPELNFPAFNKAAAMLRQAGFEVINPAELCKDDGMTWHDCMRVDIKALCDCDDIGLLQGWEGSSGAHLEVHIAHRIGLGIRFVPELERELYPAMVVDQDGGTVAACP